MSKDGKINLEAKGVMKGLKTTNFSSKSFTAMLKKKHNFEVRGEKTRESDGNQEFRRKSKIRFDQVW
jgi:hypothetical protein